MKRILLILFVLAALTAPTVDLCAQGGSQVSIQSDRMEFRANGDQHRNLVMLVSEGQLQTITLMTTDFRLVTELYVDSIQDAPKLELAVNVSSLTTCYEELDAQVLSEEYIDFGEIETMKYSLLSFATGRVFRLENEKRIEASGRGVLSMGEQIDTVSVEMGIRYLEGNEITEMRMPGNMVHLDGTIYFRLSTFGIEVPKEQRLLVNDQVQLRFDIYASTEYELPAETASMGGPAEGEMTGETEAGQ